jgi:hypothetical protein
MAKASTASGGSAARSARANLFGLNAMISDSQMRKLCEIADILMPERREE